MFGVAIFSKKEAFVNCFQYFATLLFKAAGRFCKTIENMKKHGEELGNIKLINNKGRVKDIPVKCLRNNQYKTIVRGFL